MSSRKSRRIFDETELYNFCLAEVCGMGMEEEKNRFNFLDFISEEYGRKFEILSEAGQRAFEKKLTKTAKLLVEEFEGLSDNVETDEDYQELCERKNILANEVASHMEEFLVYE